METETSTLDYDNVYIYIDLFVHWGNSNHLGVFAVAVVVLVRENLSVIKHSNETNCCFQCRHNSPAVKLWWIFPVSYFIAIFIAVPVSYFIHCQRSERGSGHWGRNQLVLGDKGPAAAQQCYPAMGPVLVLGTAGSNSCQPRKSQLWSLWASHGHFE